nr:hypothetical protein Iba_chr10eCG6320 [Ipomoea batatas]
MAYGFEMEHPGQSTMKIHVHEAVHERGRVVESEQKVPRPNPHPVHECGLGTKAKDGDIRAGVRAYANSLSIWIAASCTDLLGPNSIDGTGMGVQIANVRPGVGDDLTKPSEKLLGFNLFSDNTVRRCNSIDPLGYLERLPRTALEIIQELIKTLLPRLQASA